MSIIPVPSETDSEGSGIQDLSELQSEFKTSLGNLMILCLKIKQLKGRLGKTNLGWGVEMAWSIRALAKQIPGGRTEQTDPQRICLLTTHTRKKSYIQNKKNLKYKRAYNVA